MRIDWFQEDAIGGWCLIYASTLSPSRFRLAPFPVTYRMGQTAP